MEKLNGSPIFNQLGTRKQANDCHVQKEEACENMLAYSKIDGRELAAY